MTGLVKERFALPILGPIFTFPWVVSWWHYPFSWNPLSFYQRGKSWWYDFWSHGERYPGCIGPVSKTVTKEILATKKVEAVKGRYELPSKKSSPHLGDFVRLLGLLPDEPSAAFSADIRRLLARSPASVRE